MNVYAGGLRAAAAALVLVATATVLHAPGSFSSSRSQSIVLLDAASLVAAISAASLIGWSLLSRRTPAGARLRGAGALGLGVLGGLTAQFHLLGGTWSIPVLTWSVDAALVLLCLDARVPRRMLVIAALLFPLADGPWLDILAVSRVMAGIVALGGGSLLFAKCLLLASRGPSAGRAAEAAAVTPAHA